MNASQAANGRTNCPDVSSEPLGFTPGDIGSDRRQFVRWNVIRSLCEEREKLHGLTSFGHAPQLTNFSTDHRTWNVPLAARISIQPFSDPHSVVEVNGPKSEEIFGR